MMDDIRQCFRRIHRWAQCYVQRHTRETGLTPAQIEALRHIVYHKTMSQQELVEDMGIDKAAVTRIVAALEREGYLCRCPDPRDGRAKLIHSTEKAIHIKDDVAALENEYYDWLLQGLSPEGRESFERQLRRLMQRAREGRRCCYSQIRGEDGNQCS